MKKQFIYTIIGTIVVIILAVSYVSYAIISPTVTPSSKTYTTNTGVPVGFTTTGGQDFSIVVDSDQMRCTSDTLVNYSNDNLTITLSSDGKKSICCNYDLLWDWGNTLYTPSGTGELVMEGKIGSNVIFTKDIPASNASSMTLHSDSICSTGSNTTQVWAMKLQFKCLGAVNQDSLKGKSLAGSLKVMNVECIQND